MVAPVKSKPLVTVIEQDDRGNYVGFYEATKYAQKRPFNLVLPLDTRRGTTRSNYSRIGIPLSSRYDARFTPSDLYNETVRNRLNAVAFDRLRAKTYDKVQAGLNALEFRQAIGLIATSAKTLLELGRAIRRRDPRSIKRLIGRKATEKPIDFARSFADIWLSLQFGWKPLLGDIHDALEVMSNPAPIYVRVNASAKDSGGDSSRTDTGPFGFVFNETRNWSMKVKCGLLVVSVKDPLAFTLEQYGLNNPATLAWESIPFSFVVDWFANVGSFLESFTAFSGLKIENPYTTMTLESNYTKSAVRSPLLRPEDYADVFASGDGFWVSRSAGLPSVELGLKSFKPPSKERALTAISLLIQMLKRS